MISNITYLVKDYDEAIRYFVDRLKFDLIEDTPLTEDKRWVRVMPSQLSKSTSIQMPCLLLAKAVGQQQIAAIGNQAGGRVFLFLATDDFDRDFEAYQKADINFIEVPRYESYGSVVVFKDLYGNLWDLIERKS